MNISLGPLHNFLHMWTHAVVKPGYGVKLNTIQQIKYGQERQITKNNKLFQVLTSEWPTDKGLIYCIKLFRLFLILIIEISILAEIFLMHIPIMK